MPKRTEVKKIDHLGNELERYYSAREAAQKNYCDNKTISNAIKSGKMAIGYYWCKVC